MSTVTTIKKNRRWPRWIIWGIALLILVAAGLAVYRSGLLSPWLGGGSSARRGEWSGQASTSNVSFATAANGNATLPTGSTVAIRTADELGAVSAAGNLELADTRSVIALTSGVVEEVVAQVGDSLKAGDPLVLLDSSDQQTAVKQALLNLSTAQASYDDVVKPATDSEIAIAKANLKAAQDSLADAQAGPNQADLAAAYATLASAQASMQDLQAGPTQDELTQQAASLRTAEVNVAEAQRAYDQVSWRADVGMTSQAAALQEATISLESAKASYNEATAPASEADLQSAQSKVASAQSALAALTDEPSASTVASAQAQVLSAQKTLDDLIAGADTSSLQSARATVEQAQIDLESAATDLERTEIVAPRDGTVLTVDASVGSRISDGAALATIADVSDLQLTVSVAEVDVRNVETGQKATITIDALPDQTFAGTVVRVAPAADASSSVVTYDVTIALDDDGNLKGVRPGMTAVADIITSSGAAGWLVPTNALMKGDGVTRVMVVRNGQSIPVEVTVGESQGEWTVVQSDNLQAGDSVAGSLTSELNEENSGFGGPPGGGMMMGGGGPPR